MPTPTPTGTIPPSCPACRYDLSGTCATWVNSCPLSGTCPECGLSFPWRDRFRAATLGPIWLFEAAPRPSARALLIMLVRLALPWRVFDPLVGVPSIFPVVTRRLALFAFSCLFAAHALLAFTTAVHAADRLRPIFAFGTALQRADAVQRVLIPLLWPYGQFSFTMHWSYRPLLLTSWWVWFVWVLLLGPAARLLSAQARRTAPTPGLHSRLFAYSLGIVPWAMLAWCLAFTAYVMGLLPRNSGLSTRVVTLVYNPWLPVLVSGLWSVGYWFFALRDHLACRGAWWRTALAASLALLAALLLVALFPSSDILPTLKRFWLDATGTRRVESTTPWADITRGLSAR